MTTISNDGVNTYNIAVLFRDSYKWYYKNDCFQEIKLKVDIKKFLSENHQFVKIDDYHIVNLNHVEDYSFKGSKGYFIISKTKYDIEKAFIADVRVAQKRFQNNKNVPIIPTSTKGAWLRKMKQTQPDKSIATLIDVENLKYMLRIGSLTYAYYTNEKKRNFYESLKYFEQNLKSNYPLVKIDRNCFINIKYVDSYKVDSQTKTGEVSISEQIFRISRRQLGLFRKKVKESTLLFLTQKIIEKPF